MPDIAHPLHSTISLQHSSYKTEAETQMLLLQVPSSSSQQPAPSQPTSTPGGRQAGSPAQPSRQQAEASPAATSQAAQPRRPPQQSPEQLPLQPTGTRKRSFQQEAIPSDDWGWGQVNTSWQHCSNTLQYCTTSTFSIAYLALAVAL